ncbi:hypothetical protein GCM10011613_27980 [Cellvibrio zantedeschiae]|uniref:TonB-dependent receptor plug domain-containing protein n=1 Tax=Cellvibrio zantedeschiae TaxID=1237077 RepID=A0ABQ3B6H2_9GAMM|nr:TonB-dependent receptor [Cellvibrio zantedeschiae]GGY81697.1 hypothetical protein GCM10011613_27980 [Cellvibrio zantedeschiae]
MISLTIMELPHKKYTLAAISLLSLIANIANAENIQSNNSQRMINEIFNQCDRDPLLQDVLKSEPAKQLQLIYSDSLITTQMRAIGTRTGSFEEKLSSWLALYGLKLANTSSGNYLITRAPSSDFIAGKINGLNQATNQTPISISGISNSVVLSPSNCFYSDDQHKSPPRKPTIRTNKTEIPVAVSTQNNWWNIQVNHVASTDIEEVIIIGSSHQVMHNSVSQKTLFDREQIETMPHIGDDIARVFRQLPGASSGDFSPKINVRGGEQNETAMVVDGLELHKPWYFKGMDGLGSIVDANLIASADVLSGGYTAEYADKSSAIIDIKTMDAVEVKSRVGLSFLTAFAQTSGQFNNNTGNWYGSLRGGYLDLVFQLAGAEADIQPRYSDLFAKADFELSENHKLSIDMLLAGDRFFWEDNDPNKHIYLDETSWNNNIWLNLNSHIGDFIEAKTALSFIDFNHEMQGYYEDPYVVWQDNRKYRALGFKSDWTATPTPEHLFKWGLDIKDLTAKYDYFLAIHVSPQHENHLHMETTYHQADMEPEGQDRAAYLAWRYKVSEKWVTELGGRWSEHTYVELDNAPLFSPRFNAIYNINDSSQLNFSWGKFYQAQAIDDLYPGGDDVEFHPSQLAEHSIIGLHHRLNEKIALRMDAYQKKYSQLIPRYENVYPSLEKVIKEASNDWLRIAPDSAKAEGIELAVTYDNQKHFSTWANYTYSKVNDYLNGKETPRSWDQQNVFNFGFEWKYTEWHFNLSGMIRSGWPTTPARIDSSRARNLHATKPDFEKYNTNKQDGYSRLDLRILKKQRFASGSSLEYYLEIFNLLDSENPCCAQYEAEFSGSDSEGKTVPHFDNWLPFLPSFGIQYIF